jgi:hypothetical protein
MQSIFTQKNKIPTNKDLKKALGITFDMWETLVQYTFEAYPNALEDWKFATEKFVLIMNLFCLFMNLI